jgi:two-component system response regulator YesN
MYSIFIVDDEQIELEMIRDFIRWEEMGIYVAGTAVNGQEAIEKIKVIQPDIILTDVKMPIINGIELARQVMEEFDWMKIVFLTGHDELEFVKSALNVGAVGYLLKPLDIKEITNVMEKVKGKCEEVRMKNKSLQVTKANILKELIYEKDHDRKVNLVHSYSKLDRRKESDPFSLVLCSVDHYSALKNEILLEDCITKLNSLIHDFCKDKMLDVMLLPFKEDELAILLDAGRPSLNKQFWIELVAVIGEKLQFTVTMVINEKHDELINIHLLYEQTKNALNERFYAGSGTVIYSGHIPAHFYSDQIPPFQEYKLFEALLQLDKNQMIRIIEDYFTKLVHLRIRKKVICDLLVRLIDRLNELVRTNSMEMESFIETRADLYHSIYECDVLNGIESIVMQVFSNMMELVKDRFTDKNLKTVQQVREIIEHTYHKQITISNLSRQVYLSPNYMRSIFKEKTGTTIHEYLTKIRLEKAKELLGDASLKVHDIALKVGYESSSYFCSLFLKSQGVTPNEYRKKI